MIKFISFRSANLRPCRRRLSHLIPTLVGSFQPGENYNLFPIGDAKAGIMICYESHFPSLSREFARRGADVLIEMTNDGYLGDTGGFAPAFGGRGFPRRRNESSGFARHERRYYGIHQRTRRSFRRGGRLHRSDARLDGFKVGRRANFLRQIRRLVRVAVFDCSRGLLICSFWKKKLPRVT